MNEPLVKKSVFIYTYYAVLLLILTSWQSLTSAPSMLYRLAFLTAVLVPILTFHKTWFAAVITLFITVTEYGFSYSYMPTMYYYYAGAAILSAISLSRNQRKSYNNVLIVFLIYVFIIDLFFCYKIENLSYSLLILVCFYIGLNNINTKDITSHLSLAFAITTLVLSLFFIIKREQFTVAYGDYGSTLERSGWTDPNYFGMIIGMGVSTATIEIIRKRVNLLFRALYIGIILLAMPVLILNASRGALLAVGAMGIVAIFTSKQKMYVKVGVIGIIAVAFLYLLNNDYFELLEYRLAQDDGSGSGRFDIWQRKLTVFFSDGNIINHLFGFGNWGAYNLGYSKVQGFHNDYIAFLVGYGIIGFSMYMYLLFNPYVSIRCKKSTGVWTLIATVYLLLTGMTLEPLDQGRLPFWCYYFYVMALSREAKYQNYSVDASCSS